MKKTTLKLTSGILLSSLFLGNVSVVDIAKAEENKSTFESDNKNKNKNIATKVTSENGKNYLVVTAATDVKNINLTVKLGDTEKKFKHDEIKAGETIKFEIVLPENQTSQNRVVSPAKTDATLVAGTELARETLTTEVLVEGLKITTTVAYDVEASKVSVQAVSSNTSSEVATTVVAPAAVTSVQAPVSETTQYPAVAPVVTQTTQAPVLPAAAVAAPVLAAAAVQAPAAPVVETTTVAVTAKPKQAPTEVKPELKIISPDKAAAGLYQTEKPAAELPVVTTVAPAVEVTTKAAPVTTAEVTTKAAPVTTAAPKVEVTTKAAPVTTAAPKAEVTTKAAPVTTAKKEVTKSMPVASANWRITSGYNEKRYIPSLNYSDVHNGVDIVTDNKKEPILSTEAGKVVFASKDGYGGNGIIIRHADGNHTYYWHLAENNPLVKVGQAVKAGQRIGTMGTSGMSTGVHLHFTYASTANWSGIKDPMKYLADVAKKPTGGIGAAGPISTANKKAATTKAKATTKPVATAKKATATKKTTTKATAKKATKKVATKTKK